eukprot:6178993-Ditylum_brightwellii.AAC.1
MVEMLLGSEALQHWQQFKSQAKGLLILGVLGEDEEESSGEDKDDKEKGKRTRYRVLPVWSLQLASPKRLTALVCTNSCATTL